MHTIVRADKIFGHLNLHSKKGLSTYDVTKQSLAVERINGKHLLNLWGETSHYEVIPGTSDKVHVVQIIFELLLPIPKSIASQEQFELNFPMITEDVSNKWEKEYYAVFYHFEYLKLLESTIGLKRKAANLYEVSINGYPAYDEDNKIPGHYLEGKFDAELQNTINSRWLYDLK